MSNKDEKNIHTRSRLAKGLDYFSIRITFFFLVLIFLNQIGLNFYLSIVLASFGTAILNRQVNAYKQRRLTKIARKKSSYDDNQLEEKQANPNRGVSFLLSGFFLLILALFFQNWFKYYFLIFGVFNLALAGFSFFKFNQGLKVVKK